MAENKGEWLEGIPAAVTVTDENGIVLEMNEQAKATFAKYGGAELIGKNVFDIHPESARAKVKKLYESKEAGHYTITKNGRKKIIHQIPWFKKGVFAGFVEISVPIPSEMPHFDRT